MKRFQIISKKYEPRFSNETKIFTDKVQKYIYEIILLALPRVYSETNRFTLDDFYNPLCKWDLRIKRFELTFSNIFKVELKTKGGKSIKSIDDLKNYCTIRKLNFRPFRHLKFAYDMGDFTYIRGITSTRFEIFKREMRKIEDSETTLSKANVLIQCPKPFNTKAALTTKNPMAKSMQSFSFKKVFEIK